VDVLHGDAAVASDEETEPRTVEHSAGAEDAIPGQSGELDGDLRDDVDGVGDQLEMRGLLDGVFAVGLLAAISSFHFRENLGYPQRTGHWAATTQNEGMNHTND
jgi:hypothetical protein